LIEKNQKMFVKWEELTSHPALAVDPIYGRSQQSIEASSMYWIETGGLNICCGICDQVVSWLMI